VSGDITSAKWVRAAVRIGAGWETVIQVRARKVGRESGEFNRRGREKSCSILAGLDVVTATE